MSFAEQLGELVGTIIDADTGQVLPTALIAISSGMGIQEYTGSFRIPVYVGMQAEYRITLPGYLDKTGEISNFYGNKVEIMYFTNSDHTQGSGENLDMSEYDREVEYNIELSKK